MPIYTSRCVSCGHEQDYFSSVVLRNEAPACERCSAAMEKIISCYSVIGDLEPYIDENIASQPTLVKSKKHRRQLMKANGVSEIYGKNWI